MRIEKVTNDKKRFPDLLLLADEQEDIYERCGFVRSHRIENFFVENYDHPIFEDGVQLVDMVYLKKPL